MSVVHSQKGNQPGNSTDSAEPHESSLIELDSNSNNGRIMNKSSLDRHIGDIPCSGNNPASMLENQHAGPTSKIPTQVSPEFPYHYVPFTMPHTSNETYQSYTEYKVTLRKFKAGTNVRAWFEIAENEFHQRRTSEANKFTALVSSLDDEIYENMSCAIAGVPPINRYQSLKTLLIKHYSLTRGQELRKLLSGLSIKDKNLQDCLQRCDPWPELGESTTTILKCSSLSIFLVTYE